MDLDHVTLIVTCEFAEESETVPAAAFLANWEAHAPAKRAILQAIAGRPASWSTPSGLVLVRRA